MDISSIAEAVPEEGDQIVISMSVDVLAGKDAAIWELRVSNSTDPAAMMTVFADDGRQRIRNLQDNPIFDTQLTMVSIVGQRGVGKSTIASFLSGNICEIGSENQRLQHKIKL